MLAIVVEMHILSGQELRDRACEFRGLADTGNDLPLRKALLEVADEFDREAARCEAKGNEGKCR